MDFSSQLDELERRAVEAKQAAQAAVSESRDQLRQRIDQAKAEVDQQATDARQDAQAATDKARCTWVQMRADAAAKLHDFQAKLDRRADQHDAKLAARRPTAASRGPSTTCWSTAVHPAGDRPVSGEHP